MGLLKSFPSVECPEWAGWMQDSVTLCHCKFSFYDLTSERGQKSREISCRSHSYSLTSKDEKYLSIIPGIIQAHCTRKCYMSLLLQSQGWEIRTDSAEQPVWSCQQLSRITDELGFQTSVKAFKVQPSQMGLVNSNKWARGRHLELQAACSWESLDMSNTPAMYFHSILRKMLS